MRSRFSRCSSIDGEEEDGKVVHYPEVANGDGDGHEENEQGGAPGEDFEREDRFQGVGRFDKHERNEEHRRKRGRNEDPGVRPLPGNQVSAKLGEKEV